ncbi:MAG: hypothetical protein ACYDCS_03155 [Candidatus Dormibacteria bacterium]
MSEPQLSLEASLRPLVRRARAEAAARWLLMSAAVAAVWACAVLAAGRVWTLPVVALIAIVSAVLLAAGAVLSVARRPSALIAARTADRRLALAERLATAVTLNDGVTEIAERQRSDASSVARGLRVREVYPLRNLRWRALAAAASAAAALTLAMTAPGTAAAAQRTAGDHAATQKAIATISKQEQAAHRAATTQPDPAGTLHQLDQALRDALAQLRKAQSPEQALETISELGQQIQGLADPTLPSRLGAASAAGSAMSGSATLSQVAAGLAQGNLSSSAAALRSVAGSLPHLTPAQMHQLASALARAAGASTGDRSLADALQQAESALAAGNTASASQALGAASSELQAAAASASAAAGVAAAADAVAAAKTGIAAAADAGTGGQGGSSGGGQGSASSTGNGNGNGNGSGSGSGGSGGSGGQGASGSGGPHSGAAASNEQLFVPGSGNQPFGDPQSFQLAPGQNIPTQTLSSVFAQFQTFVLQTLDRSGVAPGDRDLVRQYFASLQGLGG